MKTKLSRERPALKSKYFLLHRRTKYMTKHTTEKLQVPGLQDSNRFQR